MGRTELAEEIISFCVKYGIMQEPQDMVLKKRSMKNHLEYDWFVEYIIQKLLDARYIENMDSNRLEKLLKELEELRLYLQGKGL